jgi:hypothetical protein
MDPHHLENKTSPLDGFNQNLPPGHGFRPDPPGKRVMTTMMMVVVKGKLMTLTRMMTRSQRFVVKVPH